MSLSLVTVVWVCLPGSVCSHDSARRCCTTEVGAIDDIFDMIDGDSGDDGNNLPLLLPLLMLLSLELVWPTGSPNDRLSANKSDADAPILLIISKALGGAAVDFVLFACSASANMERGSMGALGVCLSPLLLLRRESHALAANESCFDQFTAR